MFRFYFIIIIFSISLLAKKDYISDEANEGKKKYEYIVTFLPTMTDSDSLSGFYIYAFSERTTTLTIESKKMNYIKEVVLIPNQVNKIKIPNEVALVKQRDKLEKPSVEDIYEGKAIIIKSGNSPVNLTGIVCFSNSLETFSVMPIHKLGFEYTVSTWNKIPYEISNDLVEKTAYTAIVAAYDNTEVEFMLGGNPNTKTPGGLEPENKVKKTLNKADVFLIPAVGNNSDLSGSQISSDKPVAVFSGNYSAIIGEDKKYSNHIIEQCIPEYMWSKYYLLPVTNSPISSIKQYYRVFPARDSTTIHYGDKSKTINKANGLEGEGWMTIEAMYPGNIYSDKPINVVYYNYFQDREYNVNSPYQMNIIPINSNQNGFLIVYPEPKTDNSKYFISVIYRRYGGFSYPDSLKIGTFNENGILWQSPKDLDGIEPHNYGSFAKVNYIYYFAQLEVDYNKLPYFLIKHKAPFIVYAYGEDGGSFGHAPSTFKDEIIDTLSPVVSYTIDCNGNVPADTDNPKGAIIWDRGAWSDSTYEKSNLGAIYLLDSLSSNYDFELSTYTPAVDDTVFFSLKVKNPELDAYASILMSDRAGNDTILEFTYKAQKLVFQNKTFMMNSEFDISNDEITFQNNYDDIIRIFMFAYDTINQKIHIDTDLPLLIPPGRTESFKISIDKHFRDTLETSIKLSFRKPDGECYVTNEFKILVNSVDGLPVLHTENLNFGDIYNNREKVMQLIVSNPDSLSSSKPLVIQGIEKNEIIGFAGHSKPFEILNKNFPVTIDVGDEHIFEIKFKPDEIGKYQTVLKFRTEETRIIVNPVITGKSLKTKIIKQNVDFGKLKSNPEKYLKNKYYRLEEDLEIIHKLEDAIQLKNIDSVPMRIVGIKGEYYDDALPYFFVKVDDNLNNFKLLNTKNYFEEFTIIPDSTLKLPIYFEGETAKEYNAKLNLYTNTKYDYEINFHAKGTYPQTFAETNINMGIPTEEEPELVKKIKLTNLDWEYSAPMVIYDIIRWRYTISEDWDDYKGSNFKFKKPEKFPIILQPGDSLIIEAAFKNNGDEDRFATLRFISDAYLDATSLLYVEEYVSVSKLGSDFLIHPNPASDYIEISLNQPSESLKHSEGSEIEIYDVLGERVISCHVNTLTPALSQREREHRIDISHLPKGVYLVRIGDKVERFVKM
jgi:hypothetical protein